MADSKMEHKMEQTERPVLLIMYADGEIYVLNAKTYGDVLRPMDYIAQEAAKLHSQVLNIPLRQPEPPKAAP